MNFAAPMGAPAAIQVTISHHLKDSGYYNPIQTSEEVYF
jgi:hypothetical protein